MAKSLKLGFTGTRAGMKVRQLRCVGQAMLCHCIVEYLPVEFHHGDCIGADEQVHKLARALWFKVFVHPPDNDEKRAFCRATPERMSSPKPYLLRNKDIVDQTTILIAAPKGNEEKHSGTWATVRYARKLNRPIYICYPDGKLVFENVPTQQQVWAKKQSPPVSAKLLESLQQEPVVYCSVCGMFQAVSPSGLLCANQHDGAPSIDDPVTASGLRARWRGKQEQKVKRWLPGTSSEDNG
jgi:hypothetical protein